MVDRVVTGKADLAISKLSATLSRAQRVAFTRPYLVQHQALLVNRVQAVRSGGDDDPLRQSRRAGARIGVVSGTSYASLALQLFPEAELVPFDGLLPMVAAVMRGEVLAAYYDELEFSKILRLQPKLALAVSLHLIPGRRDRLAVAVSADRRQLRDWVDLYLDSHNIEYDVPTLLDQVLAVEGDPHLPLPN